MISSAVNGFSFGVSRVSDISTDTCIFFACIHAFFYIMIEYLVIALYISAPYSRILAFWLMLFVFHMT